MVHSSPPASLEALRSILHYCRRLVVVEDRAKALRALLTHMLRNGLASHGSVGNDTIPELVSAGCMHDAHHVFGKLGHACNEMSWNFLIVGYVECGMFGCAFLLYHDMLEQGKNPNGYTLVALLRACADTGSIEYGIRVHQEAQRLGFLETNVFVGSALIHMYANCGYLPQAQIVFDTLRVWNVVAWTLLMKCFIEHGQSGRALQLFERMQLEGMSPNHITFICSLQACAELGEVSRGKAMHAKIEITGLAGGDAVLVGSTLVDMYAKCGIIDMAHHVFNQLPSHNEASWNALMSGYVEHGHGREALKCYQHMQLDHVCPDAITFMFVLRACGNLKAISEGQKIHIEIEKRGLSQRDAPISNSLVEMYAELGYFDVAREVFYELQNRDVVAWTLLLSKYVDHGYPEAAIKWFEEMQLKDILPNSITFVCAIKACAASRAIILGRLIHSDVERLGVLEKNDAIGNALVDMYGRCNFYEDANQMFDMLPVRNTTSWNALMAGYIEHLHGEKALTCFQHMQMEGVCPDLITFVCTLNACGYAGDIGVGLEIHIRIEKQGLLKRDLSVGNALIDMYAKLGHLAIATKVFDDLPCRDVVSWTTLILGFVEHGDCEEAIKYFDWMQQGGFSPDLVTTIVILKACGSLETLSLAQKLHADIEKRGLIEVDPIITNALLDMYAKCGSFDKAKDVLDRHLAQDTISWTTLVSGYVERGHGEQALKLLEQMKLHHIYPNDVTLVCALKAAASIKCGIKGQKLHDEVERRGLLENNLDIGNILVDMYAKCGMIDVAHHVFDRLPVQDVVSRSALMSGYAQTGASEKVFHVFNVMLADGIKPNSITFVIILGVCSCGGLFDESQSYFEAMSKVYGIVPTLEHHTCIVGVLSRTGHIDKAISIIKRMPDAPDSVTWHMILYASRNLGQLECGRRAFAHVRR